VTFTNPGGLSAQRAAALKVDMTPAVERKAEAPVVRIARRNADNVTQVPSSNIPRKLRSSMNAYAASSSAGSSTSAA
jgi:hypothetical protein